MLSNAVVEEIRRLLEEGKLSQREISKQLRVSRGTITSVSMNRRRERAPREEETEVELGPPARCPSCGGLVYLPCRLCRVRAAKYGERGERSLLALGPKPDGIRAPNERRTREADEAASNPLRATPSDRAARLPGR